MPTTTTTETTTTNGQTTTVTTTVTEAEEGVPPAPSGPASTPFVLQAALKIKPDVKDAWLKWCVDVDKAVQDVEKGMLMHTLCVDPSDPLVYTWVELYQNDAALFAHFANPAVGAAMGQLPDFIDPESGGMKVTLLGEIAPETKEFLEGLGIPGIAYHDRVAGYTGMFADRAL